MSGLLDIIFEALGAILAHPAVGTAMRLGLAYLAIVWVAAAWWALRDAQKRTRSPIVPYAAAGGILLMTPFLFPLAVVVWRVLRPALTIAEERAGRLQRELLQEDASRDTCPDCGGGVDPEWVRCPACRRGLAAPCPACGRNAAWDWTICAWCATELGPGPAQRVGDATDGRRPDRVAATATTLAPAPRGASAGTRGIGVRPARRAGAAAPAPTLAGD